MAAKYIQLTLHDFDQVFGSAGKNGKKAFALFTPATTEAYYLCTLKETKAGCLCVHVLTSISARHQGARAVGQDAIRVCLVWKDADGWERGLGKEKRINRCGGQGKTGRDIVERALERARDLVRNKGSMPACKLCNRPMMLRVSNSGEKVFYGCIGWKRESKGCSGTSWNVPAEEVKRALEANKKRKRTAQPHRRDPERR